MQSNCTLIRLSREHIPTLQRTCTFVTVVRYVREKLPQCAHLHRIAGNVMEAQNAVPVGLAPVWPDTDNSELIGKSLPDEVLQAFECLPNHSGCTLGDVALRLQTSEKNM